MAKRYTGSEGEYLTVEKRGDYYRLTWWFPGLSDHGSSLSADVTADDSDDTRAAVSAILSTSTLVNAVRIQPNEPFGFYTLKDAKVALSVANTALLAWKAGRPWPAWAIEARSAGWTPPKGWAP